MNPPKITTENTGACWKQLDYPICPHCGRPNEKAKSGGVIICPLCRQKYRVIINYTPTYDIYPEQPNKTKRKETIMFQNARHQEIFARAVEKTAAERPDKTLKPELGASLFLITAIPGIYNKIEPLLAPDTLDIDAMLLVEDLPDYAYPLLHLAGNLHNGRFAAKTDANTLIQKLSPEMRQLTLEAIWLRTQRITTETVLDPDEV